MGRRPERAAQAGELDLVSFPDGTLRLGFKVTAAGSVFEIQRITTDAEGQEGGPMAAAEAASRSLVLVRSRGRARCLE